MSGTAALQWIKSHIVIVICVLVILVSLVGGPMVSNGWNAEIAKDVKLWLKRGDEVKQHGESAFQWPGNEGPTVRQLHITEPLLDAYKEAADARVSQTDEVVAQLRAGNRGSVALIMPELFPTPADLERDLEVLPPLFDTKTLFLHEHRLEVSLQRCQRCSEIV